MIEAIFIFICILFFSCNSSQSKNQSLVSVPKTDSNSQKITPLETQAREAEITPPDTASSDYLIYLLKTEKPIPGYWEEKLNSLDDFFYTHQDSLFRLALVKNWAINDSISVIIMRSAGSTSYDEFLVTLKNKLDFVSNMHISDKDDRDLDDSLYFYTEYQLLENRKIKLYNHKIQGKDEDNAKDNIISEGTWTIQNNGKITKE